MGGMMNCPFCGSNNVDYFVERGNYHIKCRDCYSRGPDAKTMSDSLYAWNSRVNNKKTKTTKKRE